MKMAALKKDKFILSKSIDLLNPWLCRKAG